MNIIHLHATAQVWKAHPRPHIVYFVTDAQSAPVPAFSRAQEVLFWYQGFKRDPCQV